MRLVLLVDKIKVLVLNNQNFNNIHSENPIFTSKKL